MTETGLCRPGGRGLERGRAGGRAQGDQVEAVRDGRHQAEHGGDQGHRQTQDLNNNIISSVSSAQFVTHNAGRVDGEDWETSLVLVGKTERAGVIVATAAEEVGGHPA